MGNSLAPLTLAVAAVMGWNAPAAAQEVSAPSRLCGTAPSPDETKGSIPVKLDVQATLDFDRLVVVGNGAGSAQLKPDGRQQVTGAVAALTSRAMVGQAVIRGEPGRTVRIELPRSITLYGAAGGTLRLGSIESDLSALPRLDSKG